MPVVKISGELKKTEQKQNKNTGHWETFAMIYQDEKGEIVRVKGVEPNKVDIGELIEVVCSVSVFNNNAYFTKL